MGKKGNVRQQKPSQQSLPCQKSSWGQRGLERKPCWETPRNICTREQLALLLCAEGEISLSCCPRMFWSEENLTPFGSGAAFGGTLARRGALLLHVPALLPPEGATTHGAPNPKSLACLYFTTC